jgi:hypothetical protein
MNRDDKRAVRRRIDLALSRALIDPEYAVALLARPAQTVGVQELGDTSYGSLQELAYRARAVFWDQS